jgi:hypothetical protein
MEPSPNALSRRRSRRASFLQACNAGSMMSFFGRAMLESWEFDFTESSVDEMVRSKGEE